MMVVNRVVRYYALSTLEGRLLFTVCIKEGTGYQIVNITLIYMYITSALHAPPRATVEVFWMYNGGEGGRVSRNILSSKYGLHHLRCYPIHRNIVIVLIFIRGSYFSCGTFWSD